LTTTAQARQQGNLALMFVVPEDNVGADRLKRTIKQYNVDFPVLFYGDGPRIAQNEWDIRGNPFAFLIDPQGVITAKAHGGLQIHELAELAAWIQQHGRDIPRARVRTAASSTDSQHVDLLLDLSSPQRMPLEVQIDYVLYDLKYDETGKLIEVTKTKPVEQGPELEFAVDCGAWSEAIRHLTIDLAGYDGFQYEVRVLLPGTEDARDGKGFWAYQRGWYYFDGENVNGEKN
jgi:hypothetical protein